MTFETIKKIISEKMDIDMEKIKPESSLEELEIDSLDMVEIIMDIEEAMNVSLEDLQGAKTVAEVVAFVDSKKE